MVNTRRGPHSDRGDPPPHGRQLRRATGTPVTPRPSKDQTDTRSNPGKRKRGPTPASNPQPRKRPRPANTQESIEVHGEDEDVDAVLEATGAQFKSWPTSARKIRIEIPLPTSRGRWAHSEPARAKPPAKPTPEPQTTHTSDLRLRARRIKRQFNSLEIIGDFPMSQAPSKQIGIKTREVIAESPQLGSRHQTVQGEHRVVEEELDEARNGATSSDQLQGSPELQSSAFKRRTARPPPRDPYDIPDDLEAEHPSPSAARRPVTINRLEQLSRRSMTTEPSRDLRTARNAPRLAPVHEEEQSLEALPAAPQHVVPRPECPLFVPRAPPVVSEESENEEHAESEAEEQEVAEPETTEIRIPQVPPSTLRPAPSATQDTIPVFSAHLNSMLQMMGKEGWTDGGSTWAADLVDSAMFGLGGEGIPRLTLANTLASLKGLHDELERVPMAVDLVKQSAHFASRKQALDEAMDRVDKRVAELERKLGQQDARLRRALRDGLFGYVIPMFILLLRRAFGVGLLAPDDQTFPREQGVFTPATVYDLAQISTWLRRILEPIMKSQSRKDPENGDAEPNQPAESDEEKRNRDKLWVMFKKWDEHVMRAMKEYNDELDRRQDIFEKEQRDIAIRAERERKEREELARNAEQYEDWEKSLRELAQRPRPNVVRWQKVAAGLTFAMPVVNGNNSSNRRQSTTPSSTPRTSSASLWSRPSQSGIISPAGSTNLLPAPPAGRQQPALLPTRPPPPPPPPQVDETSWDEDEVEWLLTELSRPNRRPGDLEACAEALDRTLQEVVAEKERLKRAGRYRSPGRG